MLAITVLPLVVCVSREALPVMRPAGPAFEPEAAEVRMSESGGRVTPVITTARGFTLGGMAVEKVREMRTRSERLYR